jgi:tRNA nucleotidyltransferase/poly(A) polymerase
MFKFYEVGGKVRDEILGLKSKDVDYVAVPHEMLLRDYSEASEMFNVLSDYLTAEKFEIFLETPDCYTIRAKFPADHKYSGVADFVMARKEVGYIPGTRTPIIKPGTLYDDLERRDFTLNALAKNEDGTIIDYFDGIWALEAKILVTPLDSRITMLDDPLRLLRAFRFSITKGFTISPRIWETCLMDSVIAKMKVSVSQERIREEMFKMMKHDTIATVRLLAEVDHINPELMEVIFSRDMWLKPTMEL